jgi:hypothetical protein
MHLKKYSLSCALIAGLYSFTFLTPSPVLAKTGEERPASKTEIDALMQELREQKQDLAAKEKELDAQKRELDEKVTRLDQTLAQAEALLHNQQVTAQNTAPTPERKPLVTSNSGVNQHKTFGAEEPAYRLAGLSGRGPAAGEVGTERKNEKRREPEVPTVAVDTGGVLLPKGRLIIEPTLRYSRTSALRVAVEGFTVIPAINVGLFDISEIDRDILTAAVTGRLGLTDRLEVEAYVPYLWRDDSTLGRPIGTGSSTNVLSDVDGSGLGDVEVAAHYQINDGHDGWPYFIGNLRYKSTTGEGPFEVPTDPATGLLTEAPTGSGFHAIQPSVTMLYPSDPAIFFGNLGYTFNLKDDVGGTTGEIDPGDSISAGLGMGFSINDKASFSLGYSHSVVGETERNGEPFANSDELQVGAASFGYAYQLNERAGVNFNLSFGVTDDAPDMQATVRVPIKFDLFEN